MPTADFVGEAKLSTVALEKNPRACRLFVIVTDSVAGAEWSNRTTGGSNPHTWVEEAWLRGRALVCMCEALGATPALGQ